ncbi:MAG: NAD(P)-dependent alcohol dehydrogenase [Bacteroidota bacterium]
MTETKSIEAMKTQQMKAILTNGYGTPEVLKLDRVPVPHPKETELLVKVRATSVTAAQMAIRSGKPYLVRLFMGLTKPKNPIGGTDFAGEVIRVGPSVTKYEVGDAIYGATDVAGGTHAEYLTLSENDVVLKKPDNVTFEEAAAIIEGSSTAYAFLRGIADLQSGQRVLIIGASGSIGTAAVQLAKHMGAEVTGVCSTKNVEMVKSLGADHVIDYTKDDFTQTDVRYHVIFDTVGKSSFEASKRILTARGLYLSPVFGLSQLITMVATSRSKGKRAIVSATGLRKNEEKMEDFLTLRDLLAQGKLRVPIDRTYQLPQAAAAHQYVETGHKRGNVVLVMDEESFAAR